MSDAIIDSPPRLEGHISRLEEALENLASFWFPRCLDNRVGGYHFNHDIHGTDLGPARKMVVTQARMVWLCARLAREGYRTAEMLDNADHGYRFLTEHMQDPQYGGYYWLMRANGTPRRLRKHICGQGFVLFALAEYGAVSGRAEVLRAAEALFELVEQHAHDDIYGGYREAFSRQWGTPFPWQRPYIGGGASRHKTVNTHMHYMETLSTYYRINPAPLIRERLIETIGIQTSQIFSAFEEASTNLFEPDWTPVLTRPQARYSYGHDIENIWLVTDACDAAGVPVEPHLPLFERVFDTSLRLGFDHDAGGFYFSGLPRQPADELQKVWWAQAESMVSALTMYQLTSDPKYYDVFEKTWGFVNRQGIDWENGEWFHTVAPDGTPTGPKANEWKDGYHNGRAVLECLRILRSMRPASG